MKISKREQRLQAVEKLKSDIRKSRMQERNKWLLAYGALLEKKFKQADARERRQWIDMANKRLRGWFLDRALAGFSDLGKRFPPALPNAAEEDEAENHRETKTDNPPLELHPEMPPLPSIAPTLDCGIGNDHIWFMALIFVGSLLIWGVCKIYSFFIG
ncbi:MAG: hypothetical protein LBB66_04510 [Desulfovibrio sp.]|jgi:hypothetical protein|nr:hypothetical protein [Desulfovibrio sp.]